MALDIDRLLQPIAEDEPCGEELRYDPEFQGLLQALEPQVEYERVGNSEVARTRPLEWPRIRQGALALAGRGRDLRLLVVLLRAETATSGVAGARDGLRLVRGALERHWDTLHPRLDADESDPAEQAFHRLNCLKQLIDRQGLLADLRRAPLAAVRGLGAASLRDVELADGRATAGPGETPPDGGLIDAIFTGADAAELAATEAALAECRQEVDAITAAVEARLGVEAVARAELRLDDLGDALALMTRTLAGRRPAAAGNGAEAPAACAPAAGPATAQAAAAAPAAAHGNGLGRLDTREDVIRALDLILDYYRRNEPSSPIPLLVERTKKLVPMSFLELIEDLAPAGVKQVKEIGGMEKKGKD
jgi:type VI secretion system protein ImpA